MNHAYNHAYNFCKLISLVNFDNPKNTYVNELLVFEEVAETFLELL